MTGRPTSLFEEAKLGSLTLRNRMVMAPLTRNRADRAGIPSPLAATYYAQRASAGLLVSEGIQPNALGQGFFGTPGLHTDDQVRAWRGVCDAVHAEGGCIFAQLMHCGRIGHPDIVQDPSAPFGGVPVAPSAVRADGMAKTWDGLRRFPVPRAMTEADIATTVRDFAEAARHAVRAGFDGVELHGASGLLLHQFLADGTNRRTDRYGGNHTNRMRFVVEVTEAVVDAVGPDRVGLRVSPHNTFNDIDDSEADRIYPLLARTIGSIGIAYLHVYETADRPTTLDMREVWPEAFVVNPHADDRRKPADLAAALEVLDDGTADLVAFGRLFLANPDLPRRFQGGLPLNEPDPATFYGGDHRGYSDYPFAPST
jgi:N-ethylmaleimide reductase